ncbi:uncharacterized protein LOC142348516 [Convolutriloba macropyga]|uniref:uncharacterized protein LOC142348516 n=1 Tax=Convolutriloba macropyga TaxID=536237 RepID=UPI003F51DE05
MPTQRTTNNDVYMCAMFSDYFCYLGLNGNFFYKVLQGRRRPKETDMDEFTTQLREVYTRVNWFALDGIGGCCKYQSQWFKKYGSERGLAPDEYLLLSLDFDSKDNKMVNYIVAKYNKQLCTNEIQKIGFGQGGMKVHGGRLTANFTIPPSHRRPAYAFSYHNLVEKLTFDWFKLNILCKCRPKICEDYPVPINQ